ncbi:MAG: hypothetical protein AB1894_03330 [Chloroflexota bacterium]
MRNITSLFLVALVFSLALSGYFYAVDLGPGVKPQHHRVGKNAECTCHLAECCPAVEAVRSYLEAGGERAPDPPPDTTRFTRQSAQSVALKRLTSPNFPANAAALAGAA